MDITPLPEASTTSPSETLTHTRETDIQAKTEQKRTFWRTWLLAFHEVFPVYLAVHMAVLAISCLAFLFTIRDFYWQAQPFYMIWQQWYRWDTGLFMQIAEHGYTTISHTAFFPLYPLLERYVSYLLPHHHTLIAGLIISNVVGLILLMVLYQLVYEDFGREQATRAVLYLSLFPTAFYFTSGYNESLFVCLALICFYNIRHSNWWLAGIIGFLAALTRSTGLLLAIPFCYEYLRQREFNIRRIRFDVIGVTLMPLAIGLYAIYCYYKFHNFLAFSQVQATVWNRHLHGPWTGIIRSIHSILISNGFLSFQSMRNLTDLLPDLFVLALLILSFVGPWRLPRKLWVYGIYGVALYTFVMIFPMEGFYPLQSSGRFMIEIFPAFIILAALGRYRMINMNYLMIAGAGFFFLLTQFLTNHWVP